MYQGEAPMDKISNGRATAAADITKQIETLHKRAVSIADRVQGQLAPFSRDIGPQEACGPVELQRALPPYFQNLRDNLEAISNYLDVINCAMDRAEL